MVLAILTASASVNKTTSALIARSNLLIYQQHRKSLIHSKVPAGITILSLLKLLQKAMLFTSPQTHPLTFTLAMVWNKFPTPSISTTCTDKKDFGSLTAHNLIRNKEQSLQLTLKLLTIQNGPIQM